MSLLGAAEGVKNASGLEPLPSTSNSLVGNDPSKWHTDVPSFGKVEYARVDPGVDLLLYQGNEKQLEFDFVVQPGDHYCVHEITANTLTGATRDGM
ncbi:hypothetical protein [Granulicella sibirica]|uniref:Cell surface protein n=1 Tax=Granulicella sibirica TaxID=2479048 RepID=A0A4Q0T535_9BACT|nr:hypothetical protein [Granulicella sibirica]RXH57119.1 Cell surface protein [Granulicella sibirica]